ncbi:MAG TPA: carboxypeptidase-like regulatory domain-containing protein, partial [Rhodothermales bacterium]|nr:carboxypeptidase-like regulatory domain-containing protein [Rhodothermales bacterium]
MLFAVPLLSAGGLYAQGKLAGRILDAATGEALIGANVFVESTQQGTITDLDGNYVLLNLRPGEYTVVFSYIGYATRRVEGIQISTGNTTRYDVQLRSEAVEGEEVIVQADRPLVQKDLTASKRTVLSEEMAVLPVESFLGVLSTQAGVTQGASGELHIRGGRSNEIAYLVDGLSVGNPFSTNGLATEVATNAIQEMTVVTGAFNAEYGQAMSGIVNIVTREGGPDFSASASVTVGDRVTSNDDIWGIPDGVEARTKTLEGSLGGPIIGSKLTFFVSGRWDDSDGYVYGFREHLPSDSANFNTGYFEIHGRPWWEYQPFGELEVPNEPVALNPFSSFNVTGKLSYRPNPRLKLEYTYLQDGSDGKGSGSRATDFLYRY